MSRNEVRSDPQNSKPKTPPLCACRSHARAREPVAVGLRPPRSPVRPQVLEHTGEEWSCCQGEFDGMPCTGCVTGPCNGLPAPVGMACEAFCCHGCAVSSTRMYVMRKYRLGPDPMDYQIIRFSNCMQYLSCFCHILACIDDSFREAAQIVDCIADVVYYATTGCMTAQVHAEIRHQKGLQMGAGGGSVGVPMASNAPMGFPTNAVAMPVQTQPGQYNVPVATAQAISPSQVQYAQAQPQYAQAQAHPARAMTVDMER